MQRIATLVALLVGCGGSSKPAAEPQPPAASTPSNHESTPVAAETKPPADDPMTKMAGYRDAMCACKDAPCAQQVADDMTKWAQAYGAAHKEPARLTEAEAQQATEIGTKMGECMQRVMNAGGGAPSSTP